MLVWGCCWFNEDVDCVINFINNSLISLKSYDFDTIPVVFVANTAINNEDILKLKNSISKVKVIKNNFDLYPNKNYGVYSIVSFARAINSDYVSIVDPDWEISSFNNYISTVIFPLLEGKVDIIIPNIGNASGRSNILVGKTAMKLFYKDYSSNIKSAFPGSIFGTTNALYTIVSSPKYHFDWGGEWDLISLAIKNNYKLLSKDVNVLNVRHRNNNSKIKDSFQIWRAILSNDDIRNRYRKPIIDNCNHRLVNLLKECDNVDDMVKILEKQELSKTERQLLYMILYPVKSIIDCSEYTFEVLDDSDEPYSKEEIYEVYKLGLLCMNNIIKEEEIDSIISNAKKINGALFGPWTEDSIKKVKKDVEIQIKRYL